MKASEAPAEQLPSSGMRGQLRAIQFLGWAVAIGLGGVYADSHGASWGVVTTFFAAGLALSVTSLAFALSAAAARKKARSSSKRV